MKTHHLKILSATGAELRRRVLFFKDMKTRRVWRIIQRKLVLKNCRLVKSKWVLHKKKDGKFRPRIVAKGFMEIPGVDFSETFAPVVNDETFRIILILFLIYSTDSGKLWMAEIWDIVTAFLYGDLDEEIYMEAPDGFERFFAFNRELECLILDKAIYGLVQAARQFYKKLKNVLVQKLGFKKCKADPCLFYKESELGTCIICCYVDDLAFFGNCSAVKDVVQKLQEQFDMKHVGNLKEYVGCTIDFENGKGGKVAYLTQPDIIKKMVKKFGKEFSKMGSFKTPSSPGYIAGRFVLVSELCFIWLSIQDQILQIVCVSMRK